MGPLGCVPAEPNSVYPGSNNLCSHWTNRFPKLTIGYIIQNVTVREIDAGCSPFEFPTDQRLLGGVRDSGTRIIRDRLCISSPDFWAW